MIADEPFFSFIEQVIKIYLGAYKLFINMVHTALVTFLDENASQDIEKIVSDSTINFPHGGEALFKIENFFYDNESRIFCPQASKIFSWIIKPIRMINSKPLDF